MAQRTPDFYKYHSKSDRKYPFLSLAEADAYRNHISPDFHTFAIRESGDGKTNGRKVGFFKGDDGFHIFNDAELYRLRHWRKKRRTVLQNAIGELQTLLATENTQH